ncbi:MAG: response regulator transcription factor [Deltaproteobacteria bacterium]|nr:response regulator transcription factor [Deltaproteobacteria bacterium]
MGSRILVVEDETDLAELVAFNLRGAGHDVTVAHDGNTALAEIQRSQPDLVVLDVMLPDISGLEVCRRLRRNAQTVRLPVIMLTARSDEVDRVVGFEVGADDYVPGDLVIDVPAHRVEVQGEEVLLTALEFRLLLDLASRAGRVQSRDALLERVWGYSPDVETRTVDTHVKRLREKLGEGALHIETVRGVGYRALKS